MSNIEFVIKNLEVTSYKIDNNFIHCEIIQDVKDTYLSKNYYDHFTIEVLDNKIVMYLHQHTSAFKAIKEYKEKVFNTNYDRWDFKHTLEFDELAEYFANYYELLREADYYLNQK